MFGKGIKLFRLFGFTVRLDWSWLLVAALLTWSLARGIFPAHYGGLSVATYWWMGVVGTLGLFLSIVLHEFGHSIVARRCGIPMRGITLFIFGGVAQMEGEPGTPKAEFWMSIAGPLVTGLLAGLLFGLADWSQIQVWPLPAIGVLSYLTWINVVVLGFNLLPAFPLDGGRVLRSVLWAWKRNLRWATRVASALGVGFAFLLIGWGIFSVVLGDFIDGIWLFLIGLFIRSASRGSYQQVLLSEALSGEPVSRFMTSNPVTIVPSASVQEIVNEFLYKYPYKFYPVVGQGELKGCISLDQIKQIPKTEWPRVTAEAVAAPCSKDNTIAPDADAAKALSAMSRRQLTRLMVVEHGHLLGVVALKDLLTFLSRKMELEGA